MEPPNFVVPDPEALARMRRLPPFGALQPDQLASLQAATRQAVLPPGATIDLDAPGARSLYVLLAGSMALMRPMGGDQRCLIDVCDAPCLVGEAALFVDLDLGMVAEVLQPATILALPAGAVLRRLRENTAAQLRMLGYISGRLKRLIVQIAHLKLMTGPQRLAQFLIVLSERRVSPKAWANGTVQLPFEKQTLAAFLGMTPESLSRAFRRLDAFGVRTYPSGEVSIPDVDVLRRFVEPDAVSSSDG